MDIQFGWVSFALRVRWFKRRLDFFGVEGKFIFCANVAQSVEQLTRNEQVVRSIRIVGSSVIVNNE